MIEEHLDPTAEAHAHISNLLRTLVTSAAGMAEKRVQRREAEQRAAANQSAQIRQAMEDRLRSERQTAQLVYERVHQDRWWDKATPEGVATAVEAAGTWATSDPKAANALDRIGHELERRYGIDLEDLYRHTDAGTVPAAVAGRVKAQQASQGEVAEAARKPWEAEVLSIAGEGVGAQILASDGWTTLQSRLTEIDGNGGDGVGRLRDAVSQRELDTAQDKGTTLVWRLKDGADRSAQAPRASRAGRQTAKGSRPPGKQTKPEAARDRFVKKTIIDRPRGTGPDPSLGR